MKKRLLYGFALFALVLLVLIVVFYSAFNPRGYAPKPGQTLIFTSVLILIFLVIVTLGWILFREGAKLYVERQSQREGSRIKTQLVAGAITLSCIPVFFLVAFGYGIMSRNLETWSRAPAIHDLDTYQGLAAMLGKEMEDEVTAQAALLATMPQTRQILSGETVSPGFLREFCREWELNSAAIYPPSSNATPLASWGPYGAKDNDRRTVAEKRAVMDGAAQIGSIAVTARIPLDVSKQMYVIQSAVTAWRDQRDYWKSLRRINTLLMALITVFVLFVAIWIALFLSKQISVPITALLEAASEVRKGNLRYRVDVRAADELGSLVRAFNRMTEELDANSRELDRRRRFTEAILESIPTGVLSIGADGSIKSANRALSQIFTQGQVAHATRLEDLFSREDTAEIKYLMKRARRTGVATMQLELRTVNRKLHLAVTVAALEEKLTSGFVVVLEDTSELLRAQKSAAWHEVARRVAHEIKNPLTPIALSAERIGRHLERVNLPPVTARILNDCAATISKSVESVKTLVDEFSQFARFPSAQPMPCDLNEVVEEALAVFHGRLDGITIRTSFADGLPPVNLDREQFHRVVVNLVDNAAEAMQDSLVRNLYIATQPGVAETVELVVADSGAGVSSDDKERLFLPYFSTKNRGTGLGLAIVSHIAAEHNAQIRVEDNQPTGARFTVEIPALAEPETPGEGARLAAVKV